MLSNLYKRLPRFIRSFLYQAVLDQAKKHVRQNERTKDQEIESAIPHIELSIEHIRNLQVLINRDSLLSVLPQHSVVAEVGVAQGAFSAKILSITNPRKFHLIDSWTHDVRYLDLMEKIESRFAQEIKQGQVFIHQGFSTTQLSVFDDGYFDWVYIDTSHDYETTLKELEICRSKVKDRGIIAGHDYVTGSWLSRSRYGVVEAVHEFCVKYGWEMIYLTHESNRHLSYALSQITER
ncbi:class I SAM-dependent methyltransferase [Thermodesulfobacteriota bacterium]